MPRPLSQAALKADILEAAKKIAEDEVNELRVESDARHKENTLKLDRIEAWAIASGEASAGFKVKLDALYGNGSGKRGAIERLEAKLDTLAERVTFGRGAFWLAGGVVTVALTVIGLLIAFHKA